MVLLNVGKSDTLGFPSGMLAGATLALGALCRPTLLLWTIAAAPSNSRKFCIVV